MRRKKNFDKETTVVLTMERRKDALVLDCVRLVMWIPKAWTLKSVTMCIFKPTPKMIVKPKACFRFARLPVDISDLSSHALLTVCNLYFFSFMRCASVDHPMRLRFFLSHSADAFGAVIKKACICNRGQVMRYVLMVLKWINLHLVENI